MEKKDRGLDDWANKMFEVIGSAARHGFVIDITERGEGIYYLDLVEVKTRKSTPITSAGNFK